MASESGRDEIHPLWPTWIGQMMLPGAETSNPALLDLAAAPGTTGNLFALDHPTVHWLRDGIEAALEQWFEHMKVRPSPGWRLEGRLDTLGFGHYRELRNEPGAYLAGTYFVNVPAPAELHHLRGDCLPSHFTLLDPRVGFNALALPGDSNYDETRTLAPVAGMLMLWPGFLRYFVRVHLSRTPWVRVALRIELERPAAERAS